MTIKYGLQIFFFELTSNDGQNFLAGIVPSFEAVKRGERWDKYLKMVDTE
jgi:hypothetical protein